MTLGFHRDPYPSNLYLSSLDHDPQSLTVTLDLDYGPLTRIAIPDLDHET